KSDQAIRPNEEDHIHTKKYLTILILPHPGSLTQDARVGFRYHRIIHDEIAAGHGEQGAQRHVEEYVPRPGPLQHTGQTIVGDAVKRVRYGRTRREVGKIEQGHEVY